MQGTMTKEQKDKYFKARNKNKEREAKAIEWMEHKKIDHIRYGIDALDTGYPLWQVPQFIRSAPDFITFRSNSQFLEAKSFYETIKLKTRDIEEYMIWNREMPLYILFYDEKFDTFSCNKFDDIIVSMFKNSCKMDHYDESEDNTYYILEKEWLVNFKKLEKKHEG